MDILTDIGYGEEEDITLITNLYLNVGQNKEFLTLQNKLTNLDDGLLSLLVQTMKQ